MKYRSSALAALIVASLLLAGCSTPEPEVSLPPIATPTPTLDATVKDDLQPRRQVAIGDAYRARRDVVQAIALFLDHAETGDPQAGVDAEDFHARIMTAAQCRGRSSKDCLIR